MYAVIETGGKQYKVAVGDKLKVEKLTAEAGATVDLDRVLMVADGDKVTIGSPLVEAGVSAKVISHGRGAKIKVFKMKRRKNYRRTQGHRQPYTEIEIIGIGERKAAPKPEAQAKSEVQAKPKPETQAEPKPETQAEPKPETQAEPKPETQAEPKPETQAEPKPETQAELKPETQVEPKPEAQVEPKTETQAEAEATKKEDAPAETSQTGPDGVGDDLTRISGIGPVIEGKLLAMGITTFKQIAAFDQAKIEEVNEQLSFKGRIEREEWVAQAKKLASESE